MSYELKLDLKTDAPKQKILTALEKQFEHISFLFQFDAFESGIIIQHLSLSLIEHTALYQCVYYISHQYGKRMIDLSTLEYLPYYYIDGSLNLIVNQISRIFYSDVEFIYLIDKEGYKKLDIDSSVFYNNVIDNFIKQYGEDNIYNYALDCNEVETHDKFTLIQNVEYGLKILKEFMLRCKDF